MIQQTAITRAIKAHLAILPRPVTVWENDEGELPVPPYLEISSIRSEPQSIGWCGDLQEYIGRVQASVVVSNGAGVNYAETLAEEIAAHFANAEITADGKTFRITEQVFIANGYRDAAQYRLPVQIRYGFLA